MSSLVSVISRILRSVLLVLLSHLPGSSHAIKRISVANTHILYHDGRALATCESGPPIRVQLPELETVGWYDGSSVEGEPTSLEVRDARKQVFGGAGFFSWMREWTTGHPKVDPRTGEMFLFHCNSMAPYVHYSVIPPEKARTSDFLLTKSLNAPVPGCSGGKMMHDFGVSYTHAIILDLPLSLTPFNLLKNQPIVSYEPEKPARFGIFPRQDPSQVRWFETTGCCIFHTANTWSDIDSNGNVSAVNLLACRFTSASQIFSAGNMVPPPHPARKDVSQQRPISFFAKYNEDTTPPDIEKVQPSEIDPLLPSEGYSHEDANGIGSSSAPPISLDREEQCRLYYYCFSLSSPNPTVTHQYALSTIPFEFPTVNPCFEMSAARYVYGCSTSNESFGAALGKATKIDVLVKMDVETLLARGKNFAPESITGSIDTRSIADVLSQQGRRDEDPISAFRMPPNWFAQEARFVSRHDPVSEDDGYLLFYAFDESQIDEYGNCHNDARSELWVLDAKNMTDVVAKMQLPHRVPYGLHGNWFSEEQILSQREVTKMREMTCDDEKKEFFWRKMKSAVIGALG